MSHISSEPEHQLSFKSTKAQRSLERFFFLTYSLKPCLYYRKWGCNRGRRTILIFQPKVDFCLRELCRNCILLMITFFLPYLQLFLPFFINIASQFLQNCHMLHAGIPANFEEMNARCRVEKGVISIEHDTRYYAPLTGFFLNKFFHALSFKNKTIGCLTFKYWRDKTLSKPLQELKSIDCVFWGVNLVHFVLAVLWLRLRRSSS